MRSIARAILLYFCSVRGSFVGVGGGGGERRGTKKLLTSVTIFSPSTCSTDTESSTTSKKTHKKCRQRILSQALRQYLTTTYTVITLRATRSIIIYGCATKAAEGLDVPRARRLGPHTHQVCFHYNAWLKPPKGETNPSTRCY